MCAAVHKHIYKTEHAHVYAVKGCSKNFPLNTMIPESYLPAKQSERNKPKVRLSKLYHFYSYTD